MKGLSPIHFSYFRIILGCYLVVHFASLIPYGGEIWSNEGLLADPTMNLTHGVFPNILNLYDSPLSITWFLAILVSAAILFTVGICRPIVALLLWYGWVCLFDRNNLISNPGIPFVGWILLSCAVIPPGEPLSVFPKRKYTWNFPPLLVIGAWLIMSVGYTISGFDKFSSPSWRDGTAMLHLLNNPLAREGFVRTVLLQLPETVLCWLTWSILFIEIAFLPLALWRKTRKWIWMAMILMHLGILLVVDFADLTIGMLMIHFFTFNSQWISRNFKKIGQT